MDAGGQFVLDFAEGEAMPGLTTADVRREVARATGLELSAKMLSRWAADGILTPSLAYPQQRGRAGRLYSAQDAERAAALVQLRAAGLTPTAAATLLAELEGSTDDTPGAARGDADSNVYVRMLLDSWRRAGGVEATPRTKRPRAAKRSTAALLLGGLARALKIGGRRSSKR